VRNLTSEVRENQIEWRRSQVLELISQGYNQREDMSKASARQISREQRHPVLTTAGTREPSETYP